jgi:hypothetical protein
MVDVDQQKGSFGLFVADVLADYPVALLERVKSNPPQSPLVRGEVIKALP